MSHVEGLVVGQTRPVTFPRFTVETYLLQLAIVQ